MFITVQQQQSPAVTSSLILPYISACSNVRMYSFFDVLWLVCYHMYVLVLVEVSSVLRRVQTLSMAVRPCNTWGDQPAVWPDRGGPV